MNSGSVGGVQLADRDGEIKPVVRAGERARPRLVIGAGGVIGKVQVNDETALELAEVGALDGVENVAATAVTAAVSTGGTVPQRQLRRWPLRARHHQGRPPRRARGPSHH